MINWPTDILLASFLLKITYLIALALAFLPYPNIYSQIDLRLSSSVTFKCLDTASRTQSHLHTHVRYGVVVLSVRKKEFNIKAGGSQKDLSWTPLGIRLWMSTFKVNAGVHISECIWYYVRFSQSPSSLFLHLCLSDHSVAAKSGGCFPGDALLTLENGHQKQMCDLHPGDRVLASSGSDGSGNLVYSEVLAFLDRDPLTQKLFYILRTEGGFSLSLTAAHLLFISSGNCSEGAKPAQCTLRTVYASEARVGQCVLVAEGEGGLKGRFSQIVQVGVIVSRGAFAPLTEHGTLVVNGVVASCYAVIDEHSLAHWAFAPLRLMHQLTGNGGCHGNGLHWYSRLLHWLGKLLLDSGHFHPLGMASPDRWGSGDGKTTRSSLFLSCDHCLCIGEFWLEDYIPVTFFSKIYKAISIRSTEKK